MSTLSEEEEKAQKSAEEQFEKATVLDNTNERAYSPTTDDRNLESVKEPEVMGDELAITKGQVKTDSFRPTQIETLWNDRMRLSTGVGFKDEILTNALTGFNHRIVPQQIPTYKEINSQIFITRPDINLDEYNVANSRFFSDLASAEEGSVEYAVLCALDAQSVYVNPVGRYGYPAYQTIPFDNLQAFSPMLSTQCLQATGFPDQSLDVWMSDEGAYREQYGHVDSVYEINNQFTLNVSFANDVTQFSQLYIRGLLEWSSGVKLGRFRPKTYNQVTRRVDYQSRIYVFKFDGLGKRIINWGAAMVAWPVNDNEGSLLNHDKLTLINEATKEINIRFQCIGARYRDTLLFETFNTVASYFNPDLIPSSSDGDPKFHYDNYSPIGGESLVELQEHELQLFNWKGYPIVDPDTRQLRWFLPVGEYYRIRERGGF